MAKDIHLKDVVSTEPQTPSGFRDDIIARIRDLLAGRLPCTIPDDCAVLREMLIMAEALKEEKTVEVLLAKLGEVAKMQFTLQPDTRRQLARAIPWLPTQWRVTPEVHGVWDVAWTKIIVAAAQIKVLAHLEPPSARSKSISEVINLVSNEIAGSPSLRSRQGPTRSISKGNGQHRVAGRIVGRRDKHDKRLQLAQTSHSLGIVLPTPECWNRLQEWVEVFKADFGNSVATVLSVPMHRLVKLDSCLKILDRGFLMPNQLLEKTRQLECDLGLPGAFDHVNNKITEYHEALLALATEDAVSAQVFDHPEVLQDLHSEVEGIVCASFRAKGNRPKSCNKAAPTTKTPADDGLETLNIGGGGAGAPGNHVPKDPNAYLEVCKNSTSLRSGARQEYGKACGIEPRSEEVQTWQKSSQPSGKFVQSKECAIETRQVVISRWCLNTQLDMSTLEKLLENEMDAGTFPDVWHSAAYHVNKHAPEMLVEDYVTASRNLFNSCWMGQLERRLVNKRLNANGDRGENLDVWAKVVRCSMGDGCYSWQGRTIWYHPPDHLPESTR